jgi:hypothetical protein
LVRYCYVDGPSAKLTFWGGTGAGPFGYIQSTNALLHAVLFVHILFYFVFSHFDD